MKKADAEHGETPLYFFSVKSDQADLIGQLILIQRAKQYQERRRLIHALEQQGYTVEFVRGAYQARTGEATFTIPLRRCLKCLKVQRLDAFLTRRHVEHPWCSQCRHQFPRLSERARSARNSQSKLGTFDPLAHQRCANPECPTGGDIPLDKLRKGQRFCSQACRRHVRSGPERRCGNPGCQNVLRKQQAHYCSTACRMAATYRACRNPACPTQKLVPPGRTYCSRACQVTHALANGRYQELSARGNASQRLTKQATGQIPHYQERARATVEHNTAAPPRRKLMRTGTAYGHTIIIEPEGDGYRAAVPLSDTVVRGKTKQEVVGQVKALMRARGW